MTPLRRRMIEDMRLAGLCQGTQQTYLYAIAQLARFYKRSPELLTEAQVAAYLRDLVERRKVARGTFQTARFAMQFLYQNTLARKWALLKKRYARRSGSASRRCWSPILSAACCA